MNATASCPHCKTALRIEREWNVTWWICDPCRRFALSPSPWHHECETYDSSLSPRLAFDDPSRPVELLWAGKYKNLGRPIPALRLHVQERIDTREILSHMLEAHMTRPAPTRTPKRSRKPGGTR